MKRTTKIVLIGATIASTVAAGVTNSNATTQIIKNTELTRKLKESSNNYDKLLAQNKKLSKRVITEINRILTLTDSIKGLDQSLKKNKLDLLNLSSKIILSEKSNLKNKTLTSRSSTSDIKLTRAKQEVFDTTNKIIEFKQSIIAPIYIENINIAPMKKKIRSGFTETANYKKIDGFKTKFQILNNNISDSNKKISLKLISPEDKTLVFTHELDLKFDQKFIDVDVILQVKRKKIISGNYKLIVSIDKEAIKSTNITIR